jgi:Serine dehydrogenase proteinase
VALIGALEQARGGTRVITYITSTRDNLEAQMAMDALPIIFRHLQEIETPKADTRIDLFIHSNGGSGIVPWRLATLLREYCAEFCLLVPHHAFSAATLLALGADQVVMHPMGMLGPTDPTVTTPFNPPNPLNPTQFLGISVEDVASYIALVREDVGIKHEEEVTEAFGHLARKIHPLALGSVKRGTAQSRMLAERLLRQRLGQKIPDHDLAEIIDKLTSRLYFHGHPINRKEAVEDLRLDFVHDASPPVEKAMWDLYSAYGEDMLLNEPFMPLQDAYAVSQVSAPTAGPIQLGQPGQFAPSFANTGTVNLDPIVTTLIESAVRTDIAEATYEVVLRREWKGDIEASINLVKARWRSEP